MHDESELTSLSDSELYESQGLLERTRFETTSPRLQLGSLRAPLSVAYVRDLTSEDLQWLERDKGADELGESARFFEPKRKLSAITHRHHVTARMLADGEKVIHVSYATGFSAGYISVLKNDAQFSELIAYYAGQKKQIYLDVHQRLGALGMTAVEKIQERLEDPEQLKDMGTALLLKIAGEALDRSLAPSKGASAQRGASQGDIGGGLVVNLNFSEPVKPSGMVIEGEATEVKGE